MSPAMAVVFAVLVAQQPDALQPTRRFAGFYFSHKDWEVACDNTGTCRAAGYQAENDETAQPVSILLTRDAGPAAPVLGEVRLGDLEDGEQVPATLRMVVNGKDLGQVTGRLGAVQVQAVLASPTASNRIEFVAGRRVWRVSDQGMTAILLKVDEFQGRLGTPGALVRKGGNAEAQVPGPAAMPVVRVAMVSGEEVGLPQARWPELAKALQATLVGKWDCEGTTSAPGQPLAFEFSALNTEWMLVSTMCWEAAYNTGRGYWMVRRQGPLTPVLITTDATDATDTSIQAVLKGRGLGDCWAGARWAWDGTKFQRTEDWTTGLCRNVAAGGPWRLPTLVTKVVHPNPGVAPGLIR